MSFVKNLKFFPCLYLGEIVLELVFGDVLDRNQAFPDYQMYKNVNFTWLPNNIGLVLGLVLDFCQEFEMFFLFLSGQNRLRNSFFVDFMDRRQAFPDYKNVDFTWFLNWFLPKGLVHDFCQKFKFSLLFLF